MASTNGKSPKSRKALRHYRPQRINANKHTPLGLKSLGNSIGKDGIIGAITVAADGESFDGSARLETLADSMPDVTIVEVETHGKTLIVNRRVDIPTADDPRARRLGVAANSIASVDYNPDGEVLALLAAEDAAIAEMVKADKRAAKALVGKKEIDEIIPEQWMILIECVIESEQTKLMRRFQKEGLKCRALIS